MVEVKTVVTEKLMTAFNSHQARGKIWVSLLAAVVLIALGFLMLPDPDIGIICCAVLVVLGLLMPVLYLLAVNYMMKKAIKNSPLMKSVLTQIFSFGDEIHLQESSQYIKSNEMTYAWELLYKAVEAPGAFYLYINKTQAFIVDKAGFTQGNPQDLHGLLLEKLGSKKYKFIRR